MDDPRLLDWLKLTKRALEASDENRAEVLREVALGRAELQTSLEQTPTTSAVRPELATELSEADAALGRLVSGLKGEIETRIAELRKVQSATKGYRPARGNTPAFVSRSI